MMLWLRLGSCAVRNIFIVKFIYSEKTLLRIFLLCVVVYGKQQI